MKERTTAEKHTRNYEVLHLFIPLIMFLETRPRKRGEEIDRRERERELYEYCCRRLMDVMILMQLVGGDSGLAYILACDE